MRWILGIAFGLAVACVSYATTMPYLSLADLTRMADGIVRGRVLSFTTRKHPHHPHLIYSIITLEPLETYKPTHTSFSKSITLRTLGGSDNDGRTLQVSGAAHFSVREEVIVFLEKPLKSDDFVLLGMAQGKFTVVRTTIPNTPMVQSHSSHAPSPNGIPLSEFEARLKTHVKN